MPLQLPPLASQLSHDERSQKKFVKTAPCFPNFRPRLLYTARVIYIHVYSNIYIYAGLSRRARREFTDAQNRSVDKGTCRGVGGFGEGEREIGRERERGEMTMLLHCTKRERTKPLALVIL